MSKFDYDFSVVDELGIPNDRPRPTSDKCDKCGREFPMTDLQLWVCEGVFCQSCSDSLLAGPFGDGRYCTHHDDDPAHTNDCYGPPSDEMYQIASVI